MKPGTSLVLRLVAPPKFPAAAMDV